MGDRVAVAGGTRAALHDSWTQSGLNKLISGFSMDMRGGTGSRKSKKCMYVVPVVENFMRKDAL